MNVSNSAGAIRPATVSAASATATQAWNSCTPINIRRRSRMSASAPDGSASTSMGSIAATCTIATSVSAPGSSTSSHCAPTVCIQVPIMLPTCASHNARNALMRNGAHADCFIGPRDCVASVIRPPYRGDHPGRPRMSSYSAKERSMARFRPKPVVTLAAIGSAVSIQPGRQQTC